jgi:GTP-binding protein HflX
LSRAGVLAKDELFSTLDPTTRRIALSDKRIVLVTDTVGFIRKLPPTIIAAFRATLEELADADLLVHVVDITSLNAPEQCQTVENILLELDLQEKPRITVLNKVDLLPDSQNHQDEASAMNYINGLDITRQCRAGENTVFISAQKKWGLSKLTSLISSVLPQSESLY